MISFFKKFIFSKVSETTMLSEKLKIISGELKCSVSILVPNKPGILKFNLFMFNCLNMYGRFLEPIWGFPELEVFVPVSKHNVGRSYQGKTEQNEFAISMLRCATTSDNTFWYQKHILHLCK